MRGLFLIGLGTLVKKMNNVSRDDITLPTENLNKTITMKQLFITMLLVVIAIPATSQICKRGLSANKDVVTLTIDRNTTYASFESYQKELKKYNIDIKLIEPQFTADGRLTSAILYVDCRDGFTGSQTGTFQSSKDFVGFYRIYKKGSKYFFGMVKPCPPEKPVSASMMKKAEKMLEPTVGGGTPILESKDVKNDTTGAAEAK